MIEDLTYIWKSRRLWIVWYAKIKL